VNGWRAVTAALALAALPGVARAQAERLAGRVDERTRAAVAALVDSARAAGLPADPLVNKALEGASKGADGPRIVAAVRTLAGNLGRAREALGPSVLEGELVAGAAALRAGAPAEFLTRLRREYPGAPLVPLAVMADLVARGVPIDTASRAVLALARAGVRDAELVAFRQNVERDIALGAPAGAAAAVRVNAAERQFGADAAGAPNTPPPRPRKP